MWTPSPTKYSIRKTQVTFPKDAATGQQSIRVELDVANLSVGDKPELWLYDAKAPPNQDPPAALQAKNPSIQGTSGGLTSVSHSFPLDPAYHGRTFIPILGQANDGNSGSAFVVP